MYSLPTSCPALAHYFVGVVGASPEGSDTAVEVRAFVGSEGAEDPPSAWASRRRVTGLL